MTAPKAQTRTRSHVTVSTAALTQIRAHLVMAVSAISVCQEILKSALRQADFDGEVAPVIQQLLVDTLIEQIEHLTKLAHAQPP